MESAAEPGFHAAGAPKPASKGSFNSTTSPPSAAFAAVMENGGMNDKNGMRFRDLVLSRGMTREPMSMFTAFRGRELDTKALLKRRGLL